MFIDFREREEEREGGERDREREREIHSLPPICSPTGDRTHKLLVYGTTLQPTESPSQGYDFLFDNFHNA